MPIKIVAINTDYEYIKKYTPYELAEKRAYEEITGAYKKEEEPHVKPIVVCDQCNPGGPCCAVYAGSDVENVEPSASS